MDGVGANAKMNEFCAAMGVCNLKHFDENISARKKVFDRYIENLGDIAGLKLNFVQKDVTPNYAYFPVIFDEKFFGAARDKVFSELAKSGIHARKYFYPLTNAFECYAGKFNPEETPTALKIAGQVLTLPFYPDLPLETVDKICKIIRSVKK